MEVATSFYFLYFVCEEGVSQCQWKMRKPAWLLIHKSFVAFPPPQFFILLQSANCLFGQ